MEIEVDYEFKEKMLISNDVYSLTIAANMTNEVSRAALIYSLKKCMMVFLIQIFVAVMFSYEFFELQNFQYFDT